MFKDHPKGLIAAALANMGERFGFYTMMAILTFFLMTKLGITDTKATLIYSIFYLSIYALAFLGGIIADKTKNFKGTILVGLVLMAIGYLLIAIPTPTPIPDSQYNLIFAATCGGLFVIAFGNGLFKGNLQALVGQMYDNEKYTRLRDSGFSIFYMFINVGAIFAPLFAVAIRNWWIEKQGFEYSSSLPDMCHAYLKGTMTPEAIENFRTSATEAGFAGSDLTVFANEYLNIFTTGFHYAFAIAIIAMFISLIIYIINKNKFPDPGKKAVVSSTAEKVIPEMDIKEVKQRLFALFAVFGVVIFFWFSFHQNGVTLSLFAKDYTDLSGININLGFARLAGAELFQSINPFFVVLLTPAVLAVFGALRARGKEPSTPKKIAIGMGIAATGYVLMMLGSFNLPLKAEVDAMGALPDAMRVTPMLLIGTYFILTVAELFISPLGISFVSKVSPPQYQGMMQGLWLCATAAGNSLLWIGTVFYNSIPIWATWVIFVVACLISMFAMLAMLKWLERVAK